MVCCRHAGSSLYPCTCDCTGFWLLRSLIRWTCTHNAHTGLKALGSLQWAASPVYVSTETLISPVRVGSLLGHDQDDCRWVDEGLANWEVLRALWWQCDHFLVICCKQCASGHHQVVEQRLLPTSRSYLYICTAGLCLLQAVGKNGGCMPSSQICHVSGLTGWQSARMPPNCRWIHSQSWHQWEKTVHSPQQVISRQTHLL